MPINLSSPSTTQWLFHPTHLLSTPSSITTPHPISFSSEFTSRRNAVLKMMDICAHLHVEDYTKDPNFRERNGRPASGSGAGGNAMTGEREMWLGRTETENEHYLSVSREFQNMPKSKDVLFTASTFFHRFYMRYALSAYPHKEIAATCIYIALKVEDRSNIKAQHVARVSKRAFGDQSVNATAKWESLIISHEELVLEALCYDLTLEQPLGALLRGFEMDGTKGIRGWMKGLKSEMMVEVGEKSDEVGNTGGGVENKDSKASAGSATRPNARSEKEKEKERAKGKSSATTVHEKGNGNELMESVVLELAYVICHETITTPLSLLALPNHIASTSLLLSISMITKLPLRDLLDKLDESWVKAFCEGYFEPKREGVDELREGMRDAIKALLGFRDQKLIADVLDSEWNIEDIEPVVKPKQDAPVDDTKDMIAETPNVDGSSDELKQELVVDPMEVDKPSVSATKSDVATQADAMDVDPPPPSPPSASKPTVLPASTQSRETATDLPLNTEPLIIEESSAGAKAVLNSSVEEGEVRDEKDASGEAVPGDVGGEKDEPMS